MRYQSANQTSGTKGIILTLIGIGLVLGLALIKSDLANPIKAVADFRRAEVETNRVAQQDEVDLRQYEALQEARTQAEIEELREELQHLQQTHEEELRRSEEDTQYLQRVHEQELQHTQELAALKVRLFRLLGYTGIAVIGVALLSLSVGFSVRIARRRPAVVGTSAEEWTPERKHQAIEDARQRERELRQEEIKLQQRLRELCDVSIGSNGHEDPDEASPEPFSLTQARN